MNEIYIFFNTETVKFLEINNLIHLVFRFWVYVSHKTFEQTYLHKWPNGIDVAGLQQLSDRMQYFKNPPEVHTPVITHQMLQRLEPRKKLVFSQKKNFVKSHHAFLFFIMYRKKTASLSISVYITNQILDGVLDLSSPHQLYYVYQVSKSEN